MPRKMFGLAVVATLVSLSPAWADGVNRPPELTPADRTAIEAVIEEWIERHPEAVERALERAAERRANAARAAKTALERIWGIGEGDPMSGESVSGPTVAMFFDYACTPCREMSATVASLLSSGADVRFFYKDLPVVGPGSVEGAKAALAAQRQGIRFYELLHFALMRAPLPLDRARVLEAARSVDGLDVARLVADMDGADVAARIRQNRDVAVRFGITALPAFLIEGRVVAGTTDLRTLTATVTAAAMEKGR